MKAQVYKDGIKSNTSAEYSCVMSIANAFAAWCGEGNRWLNANLFATEMFDR